MAFDLKRFQREHLEWSLRNFGNQPAVNPLLGVVEEVGELSHAFLKQQQGIRNAENLRAKEIDAVADIVIFLRQRERLWQLRCADQVGDRNGQEPRHQFKIVQLGLSASCEELANERLGPTDACG